MQDLEAKPQLSHLPPRIIDKSSSIIQVFKNNVAANANKVLYTWVDVNGKDELSLTYKEFWDQTGNIAFELRHRWGALRNERIILCYPFGLDFIVAFIGCLRAHVVPVPVYPPNPASIEKGLKKLKLLTLTTSSFRWFQRFSSIRYDWPSFSWEVTNGLSCDNSFDDPPSPEDLAFLQYTSGSTGEPKGVMIAFRCILENCALMATYYQLFVPELRIDRNVLYKPEVIQVSWLPPFHDMGLMSFLYPLYKGGSGWYLSPLDFLANPSVWLTTISRVRGTTTFAPNFAYQLVLRKWKDQVVDLSCLKCSICGAEPIRKSTVESFIKV